MTYTILIATPDEEQYHSLCRVLDEVAQREKVAFDTTHLRDAGGVFSTLKMLVPHMLITTMEIFRAEHYELLSQLKGSPLFLFYPQEDTDQTLFQETYLQGARGFFRQPFNIEEVEQKIEPLLESMKHLDSYSNTIVRSLVDFSGTHDLANKMMSVASIACKRYNLDAKKSMDILRILRILSIAIKNDSLIKTVRLFEELRIAHPLQELMERSISPNDVPSNIVYLIYNLERIRYHNRPISSFKSNVADPAILNEILRIYANKEILIQSGTDLETVWIELIEAINAVKDLPLDDVDLFMGSAIKISKYLIVYAGGGIVSISHRENTLEYIITPQNNFDPSEWLEANRDSLCSDVISVQQNEESIKLSLNPSGESASSENEAATMDFIDFDTLETGSGDTKSLNETFTDGATREKVAARDYVESIKGYIDINDSLSVLDDLEEHIDDTLNQESKLTPRVLEEASQVFTRYGSFLSSMDAFKDLSYACMTLGTVLYNADYSSLEKIEGHLYTILTGVIQDLANWKSVIFVAQSTQDIHYLDDSLLSSCTMLESMLNKTDMNKNEADDDNDLELF